MCFMWFKMTHGVLQEGNRLGSISPCLAAEVSSAKIMAFSWAVGALLLRLHLSQHYPLPLKNRVLCSSPLPSLVLQQRRVVEEMRMGRRGLRVRGGSSHLGQGVMAAQPKLGLGTSSGCRSQPPFRAHRSS